MMLKNLEIDDTFRYREGDEIQTQIPISAIENEIGDAEKEARVGLELGAGAEGVRGSTATATATKNQ